MCVLSHSSCGRLWDPTDYSLPDSSVHGISQARLLEWVAILLQGILPTQGSNSCLLSHVSAALGGGCFPTVPPGKLRREITGITLCHPISNKISVEELLWRSLPIWLHLSCRLALNWTVLWHHFCSLHQKKLPWEFVFSYESISCSVMSDSFRFHGL